MASLLLEDAPVYAPDGVTTISSESLSNTKYLLFYFSAHWCDSCRDFTPVLNEFYKQMKKQKEGGGGKEEGEREEVDLLEIIFMSSDHNEQEYREYAASMAFPALSFDAKHIEPKLFNKFDLTTIPALVVVDNSSGKVISKEGRTRVVEDPLGTEFPWELPGFSLMLHGPLLTKNEAQPKDGKDLRNLDSIGFYFSASWCCPCKTFTPILEAIYNEIKQKNNNNHKMEIIYVTSDRTQAAFDSYYDHMPWCAIPFGDPRIKKLSDQFKVFGIPYLAIVQSNGTGINLDARTAASKPNAALTYPWDGSKREFFVALNREDMSELISKGSLWYLLDLTKWSSPEETHTALKAAVKKIVQKCAKIQTKLFVMFTTTVLPETTRTKVEQSIFTTFPQIEGAEECANQPFLHRIDLDTNRTASLPLQFESPLTTEEEVKSVEAFLLRGKDRVCEAGGVGGARALRAQKSAKENFVHAIADVGKECSQGLDMAMSVLQTDKSHITALKKAVDRVMIASQALEQMKHALTQELEREQRKVEMEYTMQEVRKTIRWYDDVLKKAKRTIPPAYDKESPQQLKNLLCQSFRKWIDRAEATAQKMYDKLMSNDNGDDHQQHEGMIHTSSSSLYEGGYDDSAMLRNLDGTIRPFYDGNDITSMKTLTDWLFELYTATTYDPYLQQIGFTLHHNYFLIKRVIEVFRTRMLKTLEGSYGKWYRELEAWAALECDPDQIVEGILAAYLYTTDIFDHPTCMTVQDCIERTKQENQLENALFLINRAILTKRLKQSTYPKWHQVMSNVCKRHVMTSFWRLMRAGQRFSRHKHKVVPKDRRVFGRDISLYAVMNYLMRTGRDSSVLTKLAEDQRDAIRAGADFFKPLIFNLDWVVTVLPKEMHVYFRGLPTSLAEKYRLGSIVVWPAFSSTSLDYAVAKEFMGDTGTFFIIHAHSTASIARYSEYETEEELLLKSNCAFQVTGKISRNLLNTLECPYDIILMKEVGLQPEPQVECGVIYGTQTKMISIYKDFVTKKYVEGRVSTEPEAENRRVQKLFKAVQPFLDSTRKKYLVLLGKAGEGKSSAALAILCRISSQLCTVQTRSSNVITILIHLATVEYLFDPNALDVHMKKQLDVDEATLQYLFRHYAVVVLLDSLDEVMLDDVFASGKETLPALTEQNPILKLARKIILTSRPQFLSEIGLFPVTRCLSTEDEVCEKLYLQPFTENDTEEMLSKHGATVRENVISMGLSMEEELTNPWVLHAAVFVAKRRMVRGVDALKRVSRLQLVEHYVQERIGNDDDDKIHRAAARVAYEMIRKGKFQLSVGEAIEILGQEFGGASSGRDLIQRLPVRVAEPNNDRDDFSFTHRNIMDYLAAYHAFRVVGTNEALRAFAHLPSQTYSGVLTHLALNPEVPEEMRYEAATLLLDKADDPAALPYFLNLLTQPGHTAAQEAKYLRSVAKCYDARGDPLKALEYTTREIEKRVAMAEIDTNTSAFDGFQNSFTVQESDVSQEDTVTVEMNGGAMILSDGVDHEFVRVLTSHGNEMTFVVRRSDAVPLNSVAVSAEGRRLLKVAAGTQVLVTVVKSDRLQTCRKLMVAVVRVEGGGGGVTVPSKVLKQYFHTPRPVVPGLVLCIRVEDAVAYTIKVLSTDAQVTSSSSTGSGLRPLPTLVDPNGMIDIATLKGEVKDPESELKSLLVKSIVRKHQLLFTSGRLSQAIEGYTDADVSIRSHFLAPLTYLGMEAEADVVMKTIAPEGIVDPKVSVENMWNGILVGWMQCYRGGDHLSLGIANLNKALVEAKRIYGSQSVAAAKASQELSFGLCRSAKYSEALMYAELALSTTLQSKGPKSFYAALSRIHIGTILTRLNGYKEANSHFRTACKTLVETLRLPTNHHDVLWGKVEWARMIIDESEHKLCETQFTEDYIGTERRQEAADILVEVLRATTTTTTSSYRYHALVELLHLWGLKSNPKEGDVPFEIPLDLDEVYVRKEMMELGVTLSKDLGLQARPEDRNW